MYMKIMWNYSEAFTRHCHKTIILYFFNNYHVCRSCSSLVKLHVWINHVDAWCCFDDTSMRLWYFVQRWNNCLSKVMQLNSVKSIFLGFWAIMQRSYIYCNVEKVLENIYFVFCILYNAFQRLLVVDTNKKNIDSFAF